MLEVEGVIDLQVYGTKMRTMLSNSNLSQLKYQKT